MRLRPLEALNFATLAALSILTVGLWPRLASPASILSRYAVMAAGVAVVAVLARRADGLPRPLRILIDFYPAALIPLLYESLGPLIQASQRGSRDAVLIAADRALFGVDVTVWLQRFTRPFWNDFFSIAYVSYYFLAIVLGAVLWARDPTVARRFIFTLTVCYLASYAGYFAVPALGPRSSLSHTVPIDGTPIAGTISRTLDELENTKKDVFPSGHTMIAVVVLLVAYRTARRLFWWLLPVAACLIASTVYCRYHYVVDVIAGAILAIVTVPLGNRWYDRWKLGMES